MRSDIDGSAGAGQQEHCHIMHTEPMSISALFRRRPANRDAAIALLDRIIEQSRQIEFYRHGGVPDTLDGRFDLMVLHVVLALRRLQDIDGSAETGQAVLDRMFTVLDLNLRELGVQDVGIGRRIKVMAEGFNGRSQALRRDLATDDGALRDTLRRNAFGGAIPDEAQVTAMCGYVRAVVAALTQLADVDLLMGRIDFPAPDFAGLGAGR
jgi:cytochrome b pre-mRNA-processing protein 3